MINKGIKEEIKRLVDIGITTVSAIRLQLKAYVKREITPAPSLSDASYHPPVHIIRNHKNHFEKRLRQGMVDEQKTLDLVSFQSVDTCW